MFKRVRDNTGFFASGGTIAVAGGVMLGAGYVPWIAVAILCGGCALVLLGVADVIWVGVGRPVRVVASFLGSLLPVVAIQRPSRFAHRRRAQVGVESDNIWWAQNMAAGGWYVGGSGDPIPEALCTSKSHVPLLPRNPITGGYEDVREANQIDGQRVLTYGPWELWCPGLDEHNEHRVLFDQSRTWSEARLRATAKLKAKLRERG